MISPTEKEYCSRHGISIPRRPAIERLRDMLAFRNSIHLYQSTCGLTGKRMLTSIPPESGLVIYDVDAWSSDAWDASRYGRPYDFSRPFFPQFHDLLRTVPLPSLGVIRATMENSDYTNDITAAKDCYLLFGATDNEACLFSHWLWRNRSVVDSIYTFDSELCYECRDVRSGYELLFCDHCSGCRTSAFLSHCRGCSDCYGCVNLRQKRFCFRNEQLTESEYRRRRAEIDLGSFAVLQREAAAFEEFKRAFPAPACEGESNEDSTGNYLRHTKQCRDCFFVSESESCESCIGVVSAKDCLVQSSYGDNCELVYHSTGIGDSAYNVRFCWECWMNVSDLEYCIFSNTGTRNCFGCVGMRRAEYCILNRRYAPKEYHDCLERIRSHMRSTGEYGSFFPLDFSPHAYNRSWAGHFMPLDGQEAAARGFRWAAEEQGAVQGISLPDHINDFQDSVIDATLCCKSTGKAYRLNRAELEFYRRMRLPLPRVAPLERIKQRASFLAVHR